MEQTILKELQGIPGVGQNIARDLYSIGIRSVKDLKKNDPEILYARLCARQKTQLDKCLLYVMRGAVYYASSTHYDPELLKWWNWKDRKLIIHTKNKKKGANRQ